MSEASAHRTGNEPPAGVRFGWLKAMYLVNVLVAGPVGLLIVFAPGLAQEVFGTPAYDPALFGYSGSVPLGFGIAAAFGLRAPLRFSPVLLLQLVYKAAYLLCVVLPLALAGPLPEHLVVDSIIFIGFMVGDAIAIPFGYLLGGDVSQPLPQGA
jgi:hypothetical protein